jgi:hypothetical protein
MVNMKKVEIVLLVSVIGFFLSVTGICNAFIPGEYTTDSHTVALYHLNQTSGTTVIDSSGNGNNGTLSGSILPQWTTGAFGGGLHLASGNGVTSGIDLPMPFMTGPWATIEMTIKWDYTSSGPIPGDSAFLGYLGFGSGVLIRAYIDDSNPARFKCKFHFIVSQYEGYVGPISSNEYSVDADTWTHLAFTASWEDTGGGVWKGVQRIYVNGQLAGTYIGTGFPVPGGNADIGMLAWTDSTPWGGSIDEIRISNIARTEFGLKPCGEDGYSQVDLNNDCYVDFKDFATLAEDWLKCTDPEELGCVNCNEIAFGPATADANTVALWHLNEGVGAAAYDETSYKQLTINAAGTSYSWANASAYNLDKCLYGNGTSGSYCKSAALPIANSSNITNQMTISAWIRAEGISSEGSYVVSTNDSAILRLVGTASDVVIQAVFHDWRNGYYTGGYAPAVEASVGALDYNWHHIAGVYNGIPDGNGNANYYLYWDGVMVDHKVIQAVDPDPTHAGRTGLTLVDTGTGELYIGGNGNANQAFQGYIDDVKVEKTARTKFFNKACE